MKVFKRIFLITAVLLILSSMVFAAGRTETAAKEDVTISFWHFPQVRNVPGFENQSKEFGDFWAYLAKEFSAMDNGIKVETELIPWTGGFERFNVAIAGGNPPTIGFDYFGRTPSYYRSGIATPASKVVPHLVADTDASIIDLYSLGDGEVHALPGFTWSNGSMMINVGLLKKHGWTGPILNGPGQPYTFDQWVDFLWKVKQTVPSNVWPTVWSCGDEQGDYTWMGIFWGYGYSPFDANGKVTTNQEAMVKGYKLIQYLRDNGLTNRGIASMRGNEANDLFTSGLSVMNRMGTKSIENILRDRIKEGILDFELDLMVVPYPTEKGTIGFSAVGPTGFVFLTQDQKKLDAAAKWVDFVMQEKYWPALVAGTGQFMLQNRYANINIYAGDPLMEAIGEMRSKFGAGDFALAHPEYQRIRIAMSEAGQKIFTGMATVERAVADFHAEARRLNKE
jgi:multiple sugar transport system substrate-binding protein